MSENSQRKAIDKDVNNMYENQAKQFNDLLGATQSDHNQRRLDNEKDTENIN